MHSPANARKPLPMDGRTEGRTDGRTDGHAVKRLWLVGWTNGPMYRSKEGISGFGLTDGRTEGRTDGQPENIMPPAPKGGGIKRGWESIGILALNMLNCFKDYKIYIHIHIISSVWFQRRRPNSHGSNLICCLSHCQYHACWCSGDFRSQGISWNIPIPSSKKYLSKVDYNFTYMDSSTSW